MKKRTFLSSVAMLATAMTATAGVTPLDLTQNHNMISATSLTQDQFVLERKVVDSSVINVAEHRSHSSHSSHSSHASSRY